MNDPAILEFQSFDLESPSKSDSTLIDLSSQTKPRNLSPPPPQDKPTRSVSQSFWTFEYYQQFFDINTDEVKERIVWSMVPSFQKNYLDTYIKHNPDLYGPIWICTTLIFAIAVSGNIANYIQEKNYDFHLISYAATTIFSYVCLVPITLWVFMKYNTSNIPLSFLELLCTYGYSLSIYVPAVALSSIQVSWFQWALILIAASLSIFVLVTAVAPSLSGPKKVPVVAVMIGLHYLLAAAFLLYFFHVSFPPIGPMADKPIAEMPPAQNHTNVHLPISNLTVAQH